MEGSRFDLGFCILGDPGEHLFLSVTEQFYGGPGIHRDGLTEPWMVDPHDLNAGRRTTTHAHLQRAGTWTIYHHLKHFVSLLGEKWHVLGAQSNGDLTMNPWHVAFLGRSPMNAGEPQVCGLFSEEETREPVTSRWYRALVKWTEQAAKRRGRSYEFLHVRPVPAEPSKAATLHIDPSEVSACAQSFFRLPGYHGGDEIGSLVEFALSGKPIIEDKQELSLPAVVDRFQDVRHVFNIPMVPTDVGSVNLGEYQLFNNLNERRAALYAPVLIDLEMPGRFVVSWIELENLLVGQRHFEATDRCPTRRGQFRWYPGDVQRPRIEIFFQPGVYPFGTLGMRESQRHELVSLSCGGLSGRLGNTLEGVSRMMFDFFRCDDAIILDEGLDVCLIVNDRGYTNDQLLQKVWTFTRERFAKDDEESKRRPDPGFERGAREYPLNRSLVEELDSDYSAPEAYADVFRVLPGRSQIRSMVILARRI